MNTKAASQLTVYDKLKRFGFTLKIIGITRRIHPLIKSETVSVTHEAGAVDYVPGHKVEICGY